MNDIIIKNGKALRLGYTTGSCAAAAASAATTLLLTGMAPQVVQLTLPMGQSCTLSIAEHERLGDSALCGVEKDGGDDPDVTHGLIICATVQRQSRGYTVLGGKGVGRVTRKGLPCAPGQAAINPVPMKMIEEAMKKAALACGYSGGLISTISVPLGEETAKKTFNPRLGITGGISILGTTGIVEPMSEKALVDTIKLELFAHKDDPVLLLAPGNYGRDFAKEQLKLDLEEFVKCSNYFGEALDHIRYLKIPRLLLVGHIGKLVKLAGGIMNTHSKQADCRAEIYAAHSALCGGDRETVKELMNAISTDEMHSILCRKGIEQQVYLSMGEKILFHLNCRLEGVTEPGLVAFSKEYGLLMESKNSRELIRLAREKRQSPM